MSQKEIRWRQRFDNFENAYKLLEKYINIANPDELQRAGIIQFFEMAFELAWKVMKDYLEAEGFQIKSPKEAIKQAFQAELLADGQVWIDALEDRNLTVHTYEEATAIEVAERIKTSYFPAMRQFYENLKGKY
jgi:nucleotidyltransferase substrate binding protein (TIGR01987 family)